MKIFFYLLIFSISFLTFITQTLYALSNTNEEIIGTVNGENLYLSDLERLSNLYRNKQGKIILDKNEIKALKDNVLNQTIEKALILQEAKERNIQIENDEIAKKFDFFINKYGGVEQFKEFLARNNATIDDAKEEIKNQILYNWVKEELLKEKINLKSYLAKKKLDSVIIIYNSKIYPTEIKSEEVIAKEQTLPGQPTNFKNNLSNTFDDTAQQALPLLRTNPYPTITKAKIEELKKLEQNTNDIVSKLEEKQNINSKNKEIVETDSISALSLDSSELQSAKHESFKSLLSKFIKFKTNEEVPLLSIAQQEELDNYLKHRENITIENTSFNSQQSTSRIEIPSPQEKKEIKIAEIAEPQIIKPIHVTNNTTKEKAKRGTLIKPNKEGFKNWAHNIEQKLTIEPARNIKEKFNKIKLVRLEKSKQKLNTINQNTEPEKEVTVPGEPITIEQKGKEIQSNQVQANPIMAIHELPQQKQNIISTELNTLNIFKKNNSNLGNIEISKDLSNELEKLKRKINQRRVPAKQSN